MTDLFPISPTLSPRLRWIAEHGITILDNGPHAPDAECPETGERLYRYCACTEDGKFLGLHCADSTGWGDTEDDALVDFAKKRNIRLWNGA